MDPTKIVDTIKTHLVKSNKSLKDYETGMKLCNAAVRSLNKLLNQAGTIGEKQHITKCLSMVRSFKAQYQASQIIGYGEPKKTAHHNVKWDDVKSTFSGRMRTSVITNLHHIDPQPFLTDCKALFKRRIQNALKTNEALKVNGVLLGEFQIVKASEVIQDLKHFATKNQAIYKDTNLDEWFLEYITKPIMRKLSEFHEMGSGWALKSIVNLGININKFTPQLGSSYIDLPELIRRKQACVNVKNVDQACFAWAVVSALYPVSKDPQRISKYPQYSSVLNLKGIQFPMTIRQIPRFEKQNNVSINVYILKKYKKDFTTLPTRLTKNKQNKHVNLLLIQDDYDNKSEVAARYHYVWIKDLSRLVSRQLSIHNKKKHFCDGCLRYFYSRELLENHLEKCKMSNHAKAVNLCDRCLNRFPCAEALERHYEDCSKMNDCRIKMPDPDKNIIKFKNFKNKERVPFVVYSDLESVLKPIEDKNKYQEHIPAAIGYYMKCSFDDSLSFYRFYRGEDCIQWFANEMIHLAEDIETAFLCPYDMDPLSPQDWIEYNTATHCYICEQPFTDDNIKVRDHFHLAAGKNCSNSNKSNYRGPAHQSCNIKYQDSHVVPIVFHNLSGYDSHFILEKIVTCMDGQINLLPITKEKYISFTKYIDEYSIQFRFIDSFRFMASSLDTLASYLTEYTNLKSQFPNVSEEQFNKLTKKGVMPYDYIDSFSKFNENQLPAIDAFHNRLENRKCPKKAYSRAQQVWTIFNIQNLGQYTDLYMKTDILLLADVFEQFRTSCLKTYNLDPAHYYTLPGYTWDCMLYKTRQELELLTDVDQLLFTEKGIRGGLSQCSKRRVRANNKYMPTYNPQNPAVTAVYFDINNQYGWGMSQPLPYGGFEWVDTNIDPTDIPDDSPTGYIFEVDLKYPQQLHDLHRDLPFCPEHRAAPGSKEYKLMANLYNKEKYVIHYRNLKQALENGLILEKIHRVLKFKQSPWLKSYIDLNTNLRKDAKNEFEKNLFKLMNNAVFGKTMENIRKHSIVKLITKWDGRYGAEAYISKPEFKSCTIFKDNLVAVEMNKSEIIFNKPLYVGMVILDLAKTTIYDFHYNYMLKEFGENCSIAYSDTDSLVYEIRNQDPYKAIQKDCLQRFDTSDYPLNNIYNIPLVNKKILGLMKDENNGVIMADFIGLRSKLYTLRLQTSEDEIEKLRRNLQKEEFDESEINEIINNKGVTKKAKGVKKSVIKTEITFEDYEQCLEEFVCKGVNQNIIKSDKHTVYSITQHKVALSPYDDKRYLIPGSYETLPWGHYSIISEPMECE